MNNIFQREKMLIGEERFNKLKNTHIGVFGVGGVGSFVVEALVRAGIGKLTLIDFDIIEESNLNRQMHTNINNIGKSKVDEMVKRAKLINPDIDIVGIHNKYNEETHEEIFDKNWDYIIDAIDMVNSKILLIKKAKENNIPMISSMGTANKMDPKKFQIDDIKNTSMCPLARIIRKRLRDDKIKNVKVLYSTEKPTNFSKDNSLKGTISFIPSSAGLIIAGEAINDLLKEEYDG